MTSEWKDGMGNQEFRKARTVVEVESKTDVLTSARMFWSLQIADRVAAV